MNRLAFIIPLFVVAAAAGSRGDEFRITEQARKHWAFQPVRDFNPPAAISGTPIDQFLLVKLKEKGLTRVAAADKRTLIRRATFDLTGLPPTPEEVDAFIGDASPDAFAKLVDRLLASKHYGERWGRHWLDVVRYADTAGDGSDYPIREAYKYRNWVIDAFNNDKPYDQFIREQIAGDILAREGPPELHRDRVIATGYLAITKRFGHDLKDEYRHLDLADTIEVVGRSVLGLSIGCARCHDHKYDPISMGDYYGLYGIFNSTQYAYPGGEQLKTPLRFVPVVPRPEQERLDAEHKKLVEAADAKVKAADDERKALYAAADGRGGADFAFELQTLDKPPALTWAPNAGHVVATAAAQSPFANVYPAGTRGLRFAANAGASGGAAQVISHPRSAGNALTLYFNFDFRNADDAGKQPGSWRVYLGEGGASATLEVRVSHDRISFRNGKENEFDDVRGIRPGQWYNVQLVLDMVKRTYGGSVGRPGDWVNFGGKRFNPSGGVTINTVSIYQAGNAPGETPPTHDVDNLALTDTPLPAPLVLETGPAATDRHAALRDKLPKLGESVQAAQAERNALDFKRPYEVAYGVVDGDKPADAKIHKRGEPSAPGGDAPRGFLEILGNDRLPTDAKGSGRRQLAEWVTRPSNPLTARVMVNRVWQWHFGKGIVRTASDFGLRGEPPTHPELLDHLTSRFIAEGWSIKKLHRLMMLSGAYQMSSEGDAVALRGDPGNRLLSRFPRRRLLAEEVRDAMLATAGTLDPTPGGEHPFPPVETWNYTTANIFYAVYPSNRRSVYLMVQRSKPHPFLSLWDAADPNISTEDRPETITPKQALYLMNDPFVHEQSAAFAKRVLALPIGTDDHAGRVAAAWELALARQPSAADVAEAETFVRAYAERQQPGGEANRLAAWSAYLRALITSNGFLYVD